MIIKVDKEGQSVIEQLCDIALKQGGIQNLKQINLTLQSMELLPEPEKEDKKEPDKKEPDKKEPDKQKPAKE